MRPRGIRIALPALALLFAGAAASADPTDGWNEYARYGDYLSAQMKSLRKFGYGMFVAKMQAADGPVCSTFWLYADAPAPGCMPEIAQLWRWNEFDYEFVPYTRAHQNSYITLDDTFTNLTVTYFGSELDLANPNSQLITTDAVNWVQGRFMDDDTVMADMQRYYNRWMVNHTDPLVLIVSNDHSFAGVARTTGPGHEIGGHTNTPGHYPGWQHADVWKYPLTAVKPPPGTCDMRRMTAINWWRTPAGNQSIDVVMPGINTQKYEFIVKQDVLAGSTAPQSYTAAALNNETYVFPGTNSSFNPYTNLNTYTIVWSKRRVAFYINAGPDGTSISSATPVAVYAIGDYPSMSNSGPQAAQGEIAWADTSLGDALGKVSINLANYVAFKAAVIKSNELLTADERAGEGWSGYPPGTNWAGADAYVRSVKYYPLASEDNDGSNDSHFDFSSTNAWSFDLGDGTWNSTNFGRHMSHYFGILYAQDFTKDGITVTNLRDAKSPLAVEFAANASGELAPDGLPLMRLLCKPSTNAPRRNFFRLGTTMNTGAPVNEGNPFMFATVAAGGGELGVSGASTPLSFFAPPPDSAVVATVKLYMTTTYHGSFPTNAIPSAPSATATLTLTNSAAGNIAWSVANDPHNIIVAYQSQNPHLITVQRGANYAASMASSPYQHPDYLKTTNALWWHPAEDHDESGGILHYHIQIAADPSFAAPLVDVTNHVPALSNLFAHGGPWIFGVNLEDLPGAGALQAQSQYFWRVRAEDVSNAWSPWVERDFHFGITPPALAEFRVDASNRLELGWSGESGEYELQFSESLVSTAAWQTVEISITDTTHRVDAPAPANGFYRIRAP